MNALKKTGIALRAAVILASAAVLLLGSCDLFGNLSESRTATETVEAFLDDAKAGNWDNMYTYLSVANGNRDELKAGDILSTAFEGDSGGISYSIDTENITQEEREGFNATVIPVSVTYPVSDEKQEVYVLIPNTLNKNLYEILSFTVGGAEGTVY
ncbi:hypothetical protein [Salinispira pacifica]|uniref:Lipoprotein n=1 Tax=Salinispira pacifica TaxID=1307761 RepID=V5WNT9_9SPIO|nr:hypothetical protein [Salinispira pacifica]AHC16791.1 hypothetical protein L21SP2_3455 [Salinispira pacifica]